MSSTTVVQPQMPGRTAPRLALPRSAKGLFITSFLILVFGFYILAPVLLIVFNSFNVADIGETPRYGLDHWAAAFSQRSILESLGNTFLVWGGYTVISFPLAVAIAWVLARTRIPYSRTLELMFWVSFMLPTLATTIGWTLLLDADIGFINVLLRGLFGSSYVPLDIYSVPGIIFAHLMAQAISQKVMLLTPAFRNMDLTMEEASRMSGGSRLGTMLRVTLPIMIPPLTVVFMLDAVRIFQSFEIELILGTPINFFVYSTMIYDLVRLQEPPQYGQATALASLTLLVIALILPVQRWLFSRRQYTTVTGQFKPGLIHLGAWQPVALGLIVLLLAMLTVVPVLTLLGGSFMTRAGFFQAIPPFSLKHWTNVLTDSYFLSALQTTFTLSAVTSIISPIIFSIVAYVIVRTNWPGKNVLDSLFWLSAAIPGMLSGLGLLWLFLQTPGLTAIYGTIWALLLVMVLQGKLTGTQMIKTTYLQMGQELEDASRMSGAGWLYTYFRVWLPLIAPTMVLVGTFNFVLTAGATSSIVLLASRGTVTLSLLALQYSTQSIGAAREEAGILSLMITAMTLGVALIARRVGLPLGIQR